MDPKTLYKGEKSVVVAAIDAVGWYADGWTEEPVVVAAIMPKAEEAPTTTEAAEVTEATAEVTQEPATEATAEADQEQEKAKTRRR